MKRTLVCCHVLVVLVALVMLTAVPSVGGQGGQDVLLSKKSKGFNVGPAFAVNPHNGDLLATWTRLVPNSGQTEIWVSRAKRRPNGKYKKGKARKLSPPGIVYDTNPRVAWVEENGEFFVVWERGGRDQHDILGHAVTAAGKPTGDLASLTSDGKVNLRPVVTASASGGIHVYHSGALRTRGVFGRWRVTSLALSKEYGVEERSTLSKAKKKVSHLVVNDVLDLSDQADQAAQTAQVPAATNSMARTEGRNKDCSIQSVTTHIPASPPKKSVTKTLMCLYHGFERQDCVPFSAKGKIRVTLVPGSSSDFIVSERDIDDNLFRQTLFAARKQCSKLVLVRSEVVASSHDYIFPVFIPLFNIEETITGSRGQSAQEDAFGYLLLSETDGQVWAQAFDEDLNLFGNQDVVFDHGFTLTEMLGGNVPVSSTTGNQPNSVLVWTKDTANGECCLDDLRGLGPQQVRAHFFYLEPVD